MLSRRELMGKGAVGAAATALVLGAAATTARAATAHRDMGTAPVPGDLAVPTDNRDGEAPPAAAAPAEVAEVAEVAAIESPPPWALMSPLAAGSVLAHGWRLADLGPVRDGACVVTLQNERGRSRRLHLCRNDGTPQGLVYTRRTDLVVMNEGHGDLPTEERLAQAVAALAHVVAANEGTVAGGLFTDLLPHTERVQRFAAAQGRYADGKLR
jgi:hypothetical protein